MIKVCLITNKKEHHEELFPQIVEELKNLGGNYSFRLIPGENPSLQDWIWSLGPKTIVISIHLENRFHPFWAKEWHQLNIDKIQEYETLERGGFRVPKWALLTKEKQPDLSNFGKYVVVKPAKAGKGAMVRIIRKTRVKWEPVEIKFSRAIEETFIVQEYVHTGRWPVSYRVGTIFGEPVYKMRITADKSRRPLDYDGVGTPEIFSGKTIVASSKGCVVDANVPQPVIELAKKVHAAFPDVPLLGTDILQDEAAGDLHILEVNATGFTFHLTSDLGKRMKEEFNMNFSSHFGGARAVARGLHQKLQEHSK